MNSDYIIKLCLERYEGTILVKAWGEDNIFYNPDRLLKRGVYVMTIKEKDGDNDTSSLLNREGIYRVNTGISKKSYIEKFGAVPQRPLAGGIVDVDYDFDEQNIIMPHPVYAWMSWICVLNPTKDTFDEFLNYIDESYELAKKKFEKRVKTF